MCFSSYALVNIPYLFFAYKILWVKCQMLRGEQFCPLSLQETHISVALNFKKCNFTDF